MASSRKTPLRVLFVCTENAKRRQAFHDAALYLKQRIDYLRLIPIDKLERAALEQRTEPTRSN